MRKLGSIGALAAAAVALLCEASTMEASRQAVGEPWNGQLLVIEQRLHQNEWESARQLAQDFTEALVERSGGTKGDHREFAAELGGAMASSDPPAETILLGRV